MKFSKLANVVLVVVLCAIVGVLARGSSNAEANAVQDVSSLDRRLSLVEQRIYSLESSITRLQQYVSSMSQRPVASQPSTTNDRELSLLREEVERLGLRLNEVECGLMKLDERTTTGRKSSKPSDPCRANPDAPLRLATRP
jgi:predicted  nucleic acid-binding Zn-ribbon protein